MANINYFRDSWDTADGDWDLISTGVMDLTVLRQLSGVESFRIAKSGGHSENWVHALCLRGIGDQFWIQWSDSKDESPTYNVVGYLGVSADDADSADVNRLFVEDWIVTNLVLGVGESFPATWGTPIVVDPPDPPVVTPDPVVTITASEEHDDGFLRTQFRRQSILRRRNA